MPSLYFLDTSALLPRLLKHAPGYHWVDNLCSPINGIIVFLAEITEAEVAAALHQLVRAGTLRKKTCSQALTLLWSQVDSDEYDIIPVATAIVRRAAALRELHPLKGYDAIQLSCALTARESARQLDAARVASGGQAFGDPIFLCEDNRLLDAARKEGFQVDNPLDHLK